MHVAINGYFWNHPNTGSGQYLRNLVLYLNRLVSDLEITLIFPQISGSEGPDGVPPSVHIHEISMSAGQLGKVRFEQIDFPRACKEVGADIAHVPYWGSPLRSPVPVVVTIHDIITMLIPEYRDSALARLYNALVGASARGASHIITDSEASKQDIVKHLHIPAQQISPIHLAVSDEYTTEANLILDMAIAKKYDLPDEFVLYLGGYTVHKNVMTLILAYSYVGEALGEDFPLLLAGKKPEKVTRRFPDYDDYIDKLGLDEHIRWIGFVDEEDKPALYRAASAFVFPSKYEGFGLPPLEAMACGTPVVTTSESSIPEVVGDAAFAVEADDERGMAGAIIASCIQENLAAQMRQQGLAQAKKFSWEKTATETLGVYLNVMEREGISNN